MFKMLIDNDSSFDDVLLVSDFMTMSGGEDIDPDLLAQVNKLVKKQCSSNAKPELVVIDVAHSLFRLLRFNDDNKLGIDEFRVICDSIFEDIEGYDYDLLEYSASTIFKLRFEKRGLGDADIETMIQEMQLILKDSPILLVAIARMFLVHIIESLGLIMGKGILKELSDLIKSNPEDIREKAEQVLWMY